jgi:hypothetical protein
VRVEVLTFEGCANAEAIGELVRQALRLEAVDDSIDFIEVNSPEAARRIRFLGSPSVRVDGVDVEPSANHRTEFGLMCRTYGDAARTAGIPSIEMIRAAIRRRVIAGEGSKANDN